MDSYGILSIVPPVLSIVLSIYYRNIIFSLTVGALSGVLILVNFNPFLAPFVLVEEHLFAQVSNSSNAQVLIVILAIGGFIRLLNISGGAKAFAAVAVKFVSNATRAQLAAWTTGLSIFFTDSGNALIVGPLFKPVFRTLKICREKLAFILDTTAAPVTILIPFTSWGVYIMGLIENSYNDIGITDDAFSVLMSVWPYQFYAFLALLSIPMILSTGKDFGPMAKAQTRYDKAIEDGSLEDDDEQFPTYGGVSADSPNISMVVFPFAVMLGSMVVFLSYFAITEGIKGVHVRSGIFLAYIFASMAIAWLMRKRQQVPYRESLTQYITGVEKLIFNSLILILAWSLSSVCKDLQTGAYLASLIGDSVAPHYFPIVVFFLGALMSFATGSSFGTFAILMVIVIPVADTLGAPLPLTIAAVLSGGLFGDHTSPISDTTVLASMASGSSHIDHVSTQLVYACLTGLMTILAFFIAASYPSPAVILFVLMLQYFTIFSVMKRFGRDSARA
jgi:Na+/H+ antiporter NhaC